METVTEQPIKKNEFFRCPQSLPGVAPLTKKPEDSGYEIGEGSKTPPEVKNPGMVHSAHAQGVISVAFSSPEPQCFFFF